MVGVHLILWLYLFFHIIPSPEYDYRSPIKLTGEPRSEFAVKFDSISSAMAEQKINNALEMEADYIISTDASCLINLQAYIDQHNLKLKTMHIADVLASGWGNV